MKEIEEMANYLYNKQGEIDTSNPFEVATALYNAGYRKVDENYERYKQKYCCWCSYTTQAYQKAEKDTAREILQKIRTELENYRTENEEYVGAEWLLNASLLCGEFAHDKLDEIAAEYDVELGEVEE